MKEREENNKFSCTKVDLLETEGNEGKMAIFASYCFLKCLPEITSNMDTQKGPIGYTEHIFFCSMSLLREWL